MFLFHFLPHVSVQFFLSQHLESLGSPASNLKFCDCRRIPVITLSIGLSVLMNGIRDQILPYNGGCKPSMSKLLGKRKHAYIWSLQGWLCQQNINSNTPHGLQNPLLREVLEKREESFYGCEKGHTENVER